MNEQIGAYRIEQHGAKVRSVHDLVDNRIARGFVASIETLLDDIAAAFLLGEFLHVRENAAAEPQRLARPRVFD